ncbi:major facilitator superfamily domain-containing protein [Lentinula edodes]|uniref:Major facilitator superfamily domain-containing protein n=1 Tax=Lentinula lateritia TaxID=40482 RepID=A0A9W9DYD8_9AGAR|nr:major facilitator superfamily domain-containing protein [Lentinula edodes]
MDQHRSNSTPPSLHTAPSNASDHTGIEPYIDFGFLNVAQTTPTSHSCSDLCGVDPNSNVIQRTESITSVTGLVTIASPSNSLDVAEKSSLAACLESQSSLDLSNSSCVPASGLKKTPELSTLRLLLAHTGAALTLFLATTDATIVSTSLPTIAADLEASESQYTWVGVAYLLTQTAFQPLYGRIADIVGRMILLYSSIAIFALGSLLCAVSQNIVMLIASRALAGIGGGGIVSCVWVITAEIVEMRHRAKWSQALSVTWSCSAVAGPLLGGLFSGSQTNFVNWRWCFYLNLPLCLIGFLILLGALRDVRLDPASDASYSLIRRFDFGGLILFMGGTCCIVVGFSFVTSNGWNSPVTIVLIVMGLLILVCGSIYEAHTTRDSLFPPTMFKNITAVTILVIVFLHNFAFNAGTFYLALFYQAADGYSPLEAGVQMLPYSLGASLASMPTAWFISWWQKRRRDTSGQNLVISIGFLISALGFGLLNLLNEDSRMSFQDVFPLIAGIGMGILFHAPYQVFGRAFKSSELGTCTSAFFLVRFTGATVGISVAGAVFDARMASRITSNMGIDALSSSIDYSTLKDIQPSSLRAEVLHIVSTSIQAVWIVCTPLLGVAFLMSFLLKKFPIQDEEVPVDDKRTTATDEKPPADVNV